MIHKLKILPEFFPLVEKGKKRFDKKINVPVEILMELERPVEQGYYNSFKGEEVDAEVIIVEDTKQLEEGTAALPPPPNPWASKNRKPTDDSDNDGQ